MAFERKETRAGSGPISYFVGGSGEPLLYLHPAAGVGISKPIEALAQTAAILSFMTMNVKPDENSVVYFVGIDNARFKRPVEPGDQLKMDIEILRTSRGIWKYKAVASVDGKVAVEAELMCTIRANEKAGQ